MLQRILAVVCVLTCALSGGCNQRTEDKAQIKRVFADFDTSIQQRDGEACIATLTQGSIDRYGELVRLGLKATPDQVRALPIFERFEVLTMRLMSGRDELKVLDGKGYVMLAVSRGWWIAPPDWRSTDTLEDIMFNGPDAAVATLESDGERTPIKPRFLREEGAWKFDEFSQSGAIDRIYRRLARETGMTEDELVKERLSEQLGKDVPDSIWSPLQ